MSSSNLENWDFETSYKYFEVDILFIMITSFLVLFNIIAVVLNVMFLMSVKSYNETLNATEIIQICKTTLIIVALATYLPLDTFILLCQRKTCLHFGHVCITRDLMERFFIDMYPVVMLAVAVTRLRVCLCMGNSAILVSKRSAFLTFAGSIAIAILSTIGWYVAFPHNLSATCKVFLSTNHDNVSTKSSNESAAHNRTKNSEIVFYSNEMIISRCIVFLFFGVLPICLAMIIYAKIYYKVIKTKSRAISVYTSRQSVFTVAYREALRSPTVRTPRTRNRNNEANILFSLALLAIVFSTSWLLFMVFSFIYIFQPSEFLDVLLAFSKMLILCLHPVGEGLPLYNKRQNLKYTFRKICCHFLSNKSMNADNTTCHEEYDDDDDDDEDEENSSSSSEKNKCNVLSAVEEENSNLSLSDDTHDIQNTSSTKVDNDIEQKTLQKQQSSDSLYKRRKRFVPPIVCIPHQDYEKEYNVNTKSTNNIDLQSPGLQNVSDENVAISTPTSQILINTPQDSPNMLCTPKSSSQLKSCMKTSPKSNTSPRTCQKCFTKRLSNCRNRYSGQTLDVRHFNEQTVQHRTTERQLQTDLRFTVNTPSPIDKNISENTDLRRCNPTPGDKNMPEYKDLHRRNVQNKETEVPCTSKRMRRCTPIPIDRDEALKTTSKVSITSIDARKKSSVIKKKFSMNSTVSAAESVTENGLCAICKSQLSSSGNKKGIVRFQFSEELKQDHERKAKTSRDRKRSVQILSRHF